MLYTLGAVLASMVIGVAAVRSGESGRLRVWRASIVVTGFGLLSGIAGSLSGNFAFFYGGSVALLTGLLLTLGLGAFVYRDRAEYLE